MNEQNTRSFLTSIGVCLTRCTDGKHRWTTDPELGYAPSHHFHSLTEVNLYWKSRSLERLYDKHRVEHFLSFEMPLNEADYTEISEWINSPNTPYPRHLSARSRTIPGFCPTRYWRKEIKELSARHGPIYREWLRDFYLEKLALHMPIDAIVSVTPDNHRAAHDETNRKELD